MKGLLLALLALYPALAASQDKLRIEGIAPGDEVVVMLFGRTSAQCMDGTSSPAITTFSTTGEKLLGNMLPKKSKCPSEVAVFSKKHAMKWLSLNWTERAGETRTIKLKPLINAALNIWVTTEEQKKAAQKHAQIAQDLFMENRVGVRLIWKVRKLSDVPKAPSNAADIVNDGVDDDQFANCTGIGTIQKQPFYVAKTLNVYYVNKKHVKGRNCAIKEVPTSCPGEDAARGDGNITFIGNLADSATLAHELGHAYGLRPADCGGHTGPGFPDNIMTSNDSQSTAPRTNFTLGQVFRMNTHKDHWGGTMLIKNNIPGRVPRRCFPEEPPNAACPTLDHPWP
jgi:hypothetical protein